MFINYPKWRHGWQYVKGVWVKFIISDDGQETRTTYPGREWFINARWVQRVHTLPKRRRAWPQSHSRRFFVMRYW